MLEAVSLFIVCLITHILDCYVFSKLINDKLKINIKNILIIVVLSIIDYLIGFNSNLLKFITSNLVTITILQLIYNKSIIKKLLGSIFTYFGYAVAEILFTIVFNLIFGIDSYYFIHGVSGFISNIIIFAIYIIIFKIKIVIKVLKKIISWYDEKEIFNLILKVLITVTLFYIIIYSALFDTVNNKYDIFFLSFLFVIMIFAFGYFNEKSNNNKLTVEYTQLLEYVKDYEKEVVEKGKRQHEYKNQLIVINGMIPKSNKKLKEFVEDKLEIEENIKDNIWLEKLTNLPSGGIKGLVYYKLKKMINNNIDVYIDIDEELSDEKKWFNIDKNLEDYTRIIGVYLDNAIEASTESKDKQIIIEFIENKDNIEFILSNTYNGVINYQEIDKEKFSTKGKGRGYGLSLVKEIIEKNKLLSQTREVNGKFYVQKLTIKK